MRLLALDVGTRRTGIAFYEPSTAIPLPLDTVSHRTKEELVARILTLITERQIDRVLVGLPLLLSGAEGSQTAFARSVGEMVEKSGVEVTYMDERYSTPKRVSAKTLKHAPPPSSYDGDAAAACSLLASWSGLEKI